MVWKRLDARRRNLAKLAAAAVLLIATGAAAADGFYWKQINSNGGFPLHQEGSYKKAGLRCLAMNQGTGYDCGATTCLLVAGGGQPSLKALPCESHNPPLASGQNRSCYIQLQSGEKPWIMWYKDNFNYVRYYRPKDSQPFLYCNLSKHTLSTYFIP